MTYTFMLTMWTVAGLFIVGPVTTSIPCIETFEYYERMMYNYGGGSMDFACEATAGTQPPASNALPEPNELPE